MSRQGYAIALAVLLSALAACSKQPTADECKAGITRMMEIQIDALDAPGGVTASIRADLTDEQKKSAARFLKEQIPSMVTPSFVDQCVKRMKATDLRCTMSASTPDELVQKCHWKVGSGAKGSTLGF
jgi:hypothetical protein